MTAARKAGSWIAASTLLISSTVGVSFWSYQKIEVAALATRHTQLVLGNADRLLFSLKDAETGQRGFLLTGDETYLEPYLLARSTLPAQLQTLNELTLLPSAQVHLDAVTPLVDAKLEALQRVIDLRRQHKLPGALAAFAGGEGKRIMAAIGVEMSEFIRQEEEEQRKREDKYQQTMGLLLVIISIVSILALLFAVAFAYLIYRQSQQRVKDQVLLETKHLLEIQQQTNQQLQQANTCLQMSEEKLAVTLDSIGDGVIATDVQGRITLLNPLAQQLTGWTQEEACGRPVEEVFHIINQHTRLPALVPVMETLASGTVQGLANHTVLIARDGGECDIADSCAPIRDRNAQVVGAVLVFRDVTQEYAVQQSLRTQQLYTRSLIESSMDALIATDPHGVITDVNQQMVDLTGHAREALLGSAFKTYFSDPVLADAIMLRVLDEKRVFDHELTVRASNGQETVVSYSGTVFYDGNGKLQGVFSATRDISERKRVDQLLIDKNEELELAKSAAEEANRAKSDFLATMSHEIRTPMNGVIGMIDVLQQSSLNAPQMEMSNIIHDSAFALLAVINDILDFSKIEAKKLETETVPMSISEVVEGACESMSQMALKKGVELTLFVDPTIPDAVLGDPGRLRQVLINLTNNAIKFSSGQGRIGQVSVRAMLAARQQDAVTLEFHISDNGIGIDDMTRARLFTAFIQADPSITRNFGGTGLGLAISGQLVQLMRGEIAVRSELGHGSVFSVSIPYAIGVVPDGHVADPHLVAGLNCLVLMGQEGMGDDIAAYLSSENALVRRAHDLAAAQAWMAARLQGLSVVIVDAADEYTTLNALRSFTSTSDQHFVRIGRGKRRRPRVDAPDLVSVDANLLTRKALLQTVAIAAGRAAAPQRDSLAVVFKAAPIPVSREAALSEGRLILVAEDNEYNQKVVMQQLMLLGRTADIANNGREALKRWRSGDYCLLLADLHMPEMDGYELTTAIRFAEAGKSRMPIIAFTANALKGEADHCIAMGMDDYLSKPVQLAQLKAMLKKWQPMPVALAAVDVSVLKALVGGEVETLRDFLNDFYSSSNHIAAELRTACVAFDAVQVGALAHKLKSSARSVGALPLGELCSALETAGKGAALESLGLLLPDFEKELERVNQFITHWNNKHAH